LPNRLLFFLLFIFCLYLLQVELFLVQVAKIGLTGLQGTTALSKCNAQTQTHEQGVENLGFSLEQIIRPHVHTHTLADLTLRNEKGAQ